MLFMVLVLSCITLYSTLAMKQDHSTDLYRCCVFTGPFILKCYAQVETVQQLLEMFLVVVGSKVCFNTLS